MSKRLHLLQRAHVAALEPAWRAFARAAADPERAQRRRLRAILRGARGTAWATEHGLRGDEDIATFRRRVPVGDYGTFAPWIDRIAAGERAVLTRAPVLMLERTGGSTAANKLIPYTAALRAEFAAATGPWMRDLQRALPGLFGTTSYWSVSPAGRGRETTSGGLPVGFEDDTEYFGPLERWALRRMMAVPPEVARERDVDAWRRRTALHLLEARNLGLISVWSPSFLTLLMGYIARELDGLLASVGGRRAAEIRAGLDARGRVVGEALWPRLGLISCWSQGTAAELLPQLRGFFPDVPIQGKGLLATEGVVSLPLWNREGAALAVAGHLLELAPVGSDGARPLSAHELRVGAEYAPILTTGGGLYRYRLGDVVRCVGHFRRTPLVRFVGRLDGVSDLAGEKLDPRQVDAALAAAREATGLTYRFALLAPAGRRPPHYRLFVETEAGDRVIAAAAAFLEERLAEGHHYRYCRDLGQLGPIGWQRVERGWERYAAALVSTGVRAGDIKPTHLDGRRGLAAAFAEEE